MGETQDRSSRWVTFSWLWVTAPLVLVLAGVAIATGRVPLGPDWLVWAPLVVVLLVQALRLRGRLRAQRTRQQGSAPVETTTPRGWTQGRVLLLLAAAYAPPITVGVVVGLEKHSLLWALGVIVGGSALVILAFVPVGLGLSLREERRATRTARGA